MDEFHFYSRPAPRLGLAGAAASSCPTSQFLLMSATLGDVTRFVGRRHPSYRAAHRGRRQRRATRAPALLLRLDAAARDHRGPAQHQAVARLHRALHAGVRRRAGPVAHEHQHVHPRGEGPDRRPDRRFPVHRRLRQDPQPAGAGTAPASTTPACCRSTAASSSCWRRPACSRSSAAPTPSASASTCRSVPCSSPA